MKKHLYLLILILLLSMLNTVNVLAMIEEKKFDIPIDKEWTITLNENISEENIGDKVYIDSFNYKEEVEISVKDNIIKVKPLNNLKNHAEYKLVIEKGLLSDEGSELKESYEVPFVTVDVEREISSNISTKSGYDLVLDSEYKFDWKISHNNYRQFVMDGVSLGSVVSGYSTEKGYEKFGIKVGDSKEDVNNLHGESLVFIEKENSRFSLDSNGEYGYYLIDDIYVVYFYDLHDNRKVRSILWLRSEEEDKKVGFYGDLGLSFQESSEDMMYELINNTRVLKGLDTLIYDKDLNKVSRLHSEDMVNKNYFDHINKEGMTPLDRLEIKGYNVSYVGENLAYGQQNAIYAHEGLMNSKLHRDSILNENYTHVGIGVYFHDDGSPYYTINFYSPR